MSQLDPGQLAYADQLRAQLADLVADKRQHDAAGCKLPELCLGTPLEVEPGACSTVLDLLRLAIIDLAHSDYRWKEGT